MANIRPLNPVFLFGTATWRVAASMRKFALLVLLALGASLTSFAPAHACSSGQIKVLVNDEPISQCDIEQRSNLTLMSSPDVQRRFRAKMKAPNIQERFRAFAIKRNPRSRAEVKALQKVFVRSLRSQAQREARRGVGKKALKELIDERIKLQAGKRLGITVTKARLDNIITDIAKRNKRTVKQFAKMLGQQNVKLREFKRRLKANLVWRGVVRRKFGRQIRVGNLEVDRLVAGNSNGDKQTEVKLQRVSVALPGKLNEAKRAATYSKADEIRRRSRNCKSTAALAKRLPGARVDVLGRKRVDTLVEPTRSYLMNAKVGQMTPPVPTSSGFEMYVLCDKRVVKGDSKTRAKVTSDLRQKEFQRLAKRHLRDLKQDAFIEYR